MLGKTDIIVFVILTALFVVFVYFMTRQKSITQEE